MTSQEAQLNLAIQSLKRDPKQSVRSVAKIYNVPRATLQARISGRPSRRDQPANSLLLTILEEETIVREILDLDSRGFPPRLDGVKDMANLLLADRDARRVGSRWASRFIKRQPELRTRFTRKYDYERAKCEDPVIIDGWFKLVRNTVAKYGIVDADIWNFDETGFMMGQISSAMVVTSSEGRTKAKMVQPGNREWATLIQAVNSGGRTIPPFFVLKGKNHLASWYRDRALPYDWVISLSQNGWTTNEIGVDWIKHFDSHTKDRTTGAYRLLVLDGHESHHSVNFERYCKENKIVTLCMPAHSSHILQPLDIGCFGPLKKAYGKQIENLVRVHITHITKVEFLDALKSIFPTTFTEENVRGGFRGSGLVPFEPEKVLSQLDLKPRTPTPTGPPLPSADPWVSKTPQNPYEATSQSAYIKERIVRHQNSSPESILGAVDQIAKGTKVMAYQVVLLKNRVTALEKANRTLSKRRREKKKRIREGGSLTVRDAQDIIDDREVGQQLDQETRSDSRRTRRRETAPRRCGRCGKPGHNARTCEEVEEVSDISSSE